MEKSEDKPKPRGRVLFFRSVAAMAEAQFAQAIDRTPADNWHEMFRLNRMALGHNWPTVQRRGPRRVIWWQRRPEESVEAFNERVAREKQEWTFSRMTARI